MMLASSTRVAASRPVSGWQQATPAVRVHPVRQLRAATSETETETAPAAAQSAPVEAPAAPAPAPGPPALSFKPSGAAGYVEKDSAGQSNMYPVFPSAYESTTGISSGETTAAIAAGAVAIVAIVLGLLAITSGSPDAVVPSPPGDLLTLTQYAAKFAAEL